MCMCIEKVSLENITIEYLKDRINDLRDVLNEICCTDVGNVVGEEKLNISRDLDDLIVEYMKKIK